MKIQHYAILFIIIMIPFSIICRSKIDDKIDTINDEVRINHAIDTATYDAIDTIRDVNDEFHNLYEGQTINITPAIAQVAVDVFFESMSVNFNLPFVGDETFNKNYFSLYIPAVLIIAYDGFYIYSVEENPTTHEFSYQLSPKIPYTYECKVGGESWFINFSLGNYLEIYTNTGSAFREKGVVYKGTLSKDYTSQSKEVFLDRYSILGDSLRDRLPQISKDMSFILYALNYQYGSSVVPSKYHLPDFLIVNETDTDALGNPLPSMLKDYTADDHEMSEFHRIRRETIVKTITDTLNEKMNNHNKYADMMGVTYNFSLPSINSSEWMNAIDDISIMAFVQGIPVGHKSYFNSYALGASRIMQTEYYYGTGKDFSSLGAGTPLKLYHIKGCECVEEPVYVIDDDILSPTFGEVLLDGDGNPIISNPGTVTVERIFITKEDAAAAGYYPCKLCHP